MSKQSESYLDYKLSAEVDRQHKSSTIKTEQP